VRIQSEDIFCFKSSESFVSMCQSVVPISGLDVRSCENGTARPGSSKRLNLSLRFVVRKAAIVKITIFCDVTPCTIIDVYRRFLLTWCLQLQCTLKMEVACTPETAETSTIQHGGISEKRVIISFPRSLFYALTYVRKHNFGTSTRVLNLSIIRGLVNTKIENTVMSKIRRNKAAP
jgi:hypothetical protein